MSIKGADRYRHCVVEIRHLSLTDGLSLFIFFYFPIYNIYICQHLSIKILQFIVQPSPMTRRPH